jgi:hypothetical protein
MNHRLIDCGTGLLFILLICEQSMHDSDFAARGLIPRTLDYLFALIEKERRLEVPHSA